jgi:ribosome modulation factor
MKMTPWKKGFAAGRLGKSLDACPYFGFAVWEWICGYLDGQANRLHLVHDHPARR